MRLGTARGRSGGDRRECLFLRVPDLSLDRGLFCWKNFVLWRVRARTRNDVDGVNTYAFRQEDSLNYD